MHAELAHAPGKRPFRSRVQRAIEPPRPPDQRRLRLRVRNITSYVGHVRHT